MPAPTIRSTHFRLTTPVLLGSALFLASGVLRPSQAQGYPQGGDPPTRVARIGWAQGNVSLEPAGTDSFSGAQLNYPLAAGDRLYVDGDSLSELQTSGLALRLGAFADLTVTTLNDLTAQFALAQGSIRLRTRDLYAPPDDSGNPEQAVVEVDTPNATVTVQQPGDIRVDSYPQDGITIVTVNAGAVEVSGQGFDQVINANQSIRLSGSDYINADFVGLLPPDQLDQFDISRDHFRMQSVAFRNHYVDPEMIGAADLDQYGDWNPDPQYGPVWFPRNVQYGWSPYSVGHWAVIPPWGYTWVDDEPWGFAPFHYGRWNNFGGRWGWIPGPPPSVFAGEEFHGRPPRPVYSPALVAFVGGPGFSLSLSFGGGGGGGGVTAWFPLGPREPYVPWYHTSPAYVNRVNVTNIYTTNVTEIHNTYINKTTTVYNTTNVTYVNRNTATVAVNQRDFSSGRSITPTQAIKLDANTSRQLAQAPVVQKQIATPPKMVAQVQAPPAKAAPPVAARPVVQTKQGFQRAGAPPSATPLKAPAPPPPASTAARAAMPAPRTPPVLAPARPGATAPGSPSRPAAIVTAPSRPAAEPSARPNLEVPATPRSQPPAKPAAQPATQPAAQPAAQPANQPAAQPLARPSNVPPARPSQAAPISRPAPEPKVEPEPAPRTTTPKPPPPAVQTIKPAVEPRPAEQPRTVPTKPVPAPAPPKKVPSAEPEKKPALKDEKQKGDKPKDEKPG